MNITNLPTGFAMALAQNQSALKRFGTMQDEERQWILDQARTVETKTEMRQLVSNIAQDKK